ncbi:hypothetical protein BRC90_03455 [Halobacteriales archaeon QS_4_69_34]|nr:MAG: hypothetical protein BRC90_03455 [Halobacteriales archaeon QS_4_69_34]
MVGPVPPEERLAAARRLKLGFVALVGLSSGSITLQGDATIPIFALAVLLGLGVGVVLVVLAFPGGLGSWR